MPPYYIPFYFVRIISSPPFFTNLPNLPIYKYQGRKAKRRPCLHGKTIGLETRPNMRKERQNDHFHIDVNNAFLSWESVYRLREEGETLDLRTVAAVIGGSEKTRHGIVLAKSPIAKTYGIKTAETLSDARKKCPNLLVVPPRHDIYRDFSHRLIEYLKSLTDTVEQFSIDEAFADMTGSELLQKYSAVEAANFIRTEVENVLVSP